MDFLGFGLYRLMCKALEELCFGGCRNAVVSVFGEVCLDCLCCVILLVVMVSNSL